MAHGRDEMVKLAQRCLTSEVESVRQIGHLVNVSVLPYCDFLDRMDRTEGIEFEPHAKALAAAVVAMVYAFSGKYQDRDNVCRDVLRLASERFEIITRAGQH